MLPHLGFRHCLHFISLRIAPTCWFMYFAPTLHIYIVSISTSRICRMMGRLRFYLRVVTSQLSSNRRPCGRRMWKIPSTDICNSNAAKVLVVICIRIDINGPGLFVGSSSRLSLTLHVSIAVGSGIPWPRFQNSSVWMAMDLF